MRKLKVQFSNPEHGWIGIMVSDGIDVITVDVDSKSHSFFELTTALIGLTDEKGVFSVTWLGEPVITEWKFVKAHNEIRFQFWRNIYSEPVLEFAGSYQEVCLPFLRALRALQGRYEKAELEARMQDEFPFAELDRLTLRIQAMKP
jgi:hypothetical protein